MVVVGDAGLDVVARHDGPVVPGGDSRARVRLTLGGAAANTAAWIAHLGGEAVLVARVGDDVAGRQVLSELTAAGVRCAFAVDPQAPTTAVVVLVDDAGERTMFPDHGAGARLLAEDLVLPADAAHLHLSGYVLLDPASRRAGLAVLAAAREAGLSTSVDPQSAALIDDPAAFLGWVGGVDVLLPNAEELALLGGAAVLEHVGAVAVTDGGSGATWMAPGTRVTVPAARGTCVDSTGAGDAFNAGFLLAWLREGDPEGALRAGVAAGTAATAITGAQPPSRT